MSRPHLGAIHRLILICSLSVSPALHAQSFRLPRARFVLKNPAAEPPVTFPFGTATPSAFYGTCHINIYREHALGFGADLKFEPIVYKSVDETPLVLPADHPANGTAHHIAGVDPWPLRARDVENGGQSCNVCHYPEAFEIPDVDTPIIGNPVPRPRGLEAGGVTCASCHLTPDGRIRGSYGSAAPHQNVVEPRLRTSAMCAYCHSAGKRVIGKQTQTFYEWRDDYYTPGLGRQHCQDCHMPRTIRSLAEGFNVPARLVGRHLWTGDHSRQRLGEGLNLSIVRVREEPSEAEFHGPELLQFHVINIGAGHSVPTGSNRRAIYLKGEVADENNVLASREWMFAPWYGDRPDDRAFLEQDKTRPDAVAAMQADAQGPHEAPVRAGEDRVLSWQVGLAPGNYVVRGVLIYDLNLYNDRAFTQDQTEIYRTTLLIPVP